MNALVAAARAAREAGRAGVANFLLGAASCGMLADGAGGQAGLLPVGLWLEAAEAALAEGAPARALRLLARAESAPDRGADGATAAALGFLRARGRLGLGEIEAALAECWAVLAAYPAHAGAVALAVRLLGVLGRPDLARQVTADAAAALPVAGR